MWKLDFDFGHLKFEKLGSENTMKVAGYSGLELRSKFYTKSKNLWVYDIQLISKAKTMKKERQDESFGTQDVRRIQNC